jgi:hypothetical protein
MGREGRAAGWGRAIADVVAGWRRRVPEVCYLNLNLNVNLNPLDPDRLARPPTAAVPVLLFGPSARFKFMFK